MAFKKRHLLIPAVPAVLLACVGVIAANARFRLVNPHTPDARIEIRDGGPVVVDSGGGPRIRIDEPVYDFGLMDPLTQARHVFIVHNDGQEPLRLSDGGTSCKCALARIESNTVAPGGQTRVMVEFNTGRDPHYQQTATLKTNDPRRSALRLEVRGRVRVRVAAQPSSVDFGNIDPLGEPKTARLLLYSQAREELRVTGGECSIEGLTWETSPASSEDLQPLQAKSGVWVELRTPAQVKQGQFSGMLNFVTTGRDEQSGEETQDSVQVGVAANVLRALSVYGQGVDSTGKVRLGSIPAGQSRKTLLMVKVRDAEPELGQVEFDVQPEFVEVGCERHATQADIYMVHVRVPADAPVGLHSGRRAGSLKMKVQHPRIEELDLKLEFDILPR